MMKRTAGLTIRIALSASVALCGAFPASAGLPRVERQAAPENNPAGRTLAELDVLLAAFDRTPQRQSVDHPRDPPSRDVSRGKETPLEIPLSRPITRKIVLDLYYIRRECGRYDPIYRIDCLRQGIDMLVASLPEHSEYRQVKRTLQKASRRLARIVRTHRDASAPKLVAPRDANPRFKKRRSYTAIRRSAVPQAMEQARRVVEEAATELLRSGENSERRYAHYQQISVAVDSTKVLLRSS